MTDLLTAENLIALLSLTSLEIVLGIDNIVFIAILTARLPVEKQSMVRRLGLALAMLERIALLFALSWMARLTDPLFSVFEWSFSGRDLILIGGGLFLIAKSTFEIHGNVEGNHEGPSTAAQSGKAKVGYTLVQIALLDTVFSLDSVITAIGMVNAIWIMVAAVIISITVMLIFANPISNFILRHPSVKMLALSFLLLIGVVLLADGFGRHIEKGYIYFAMGFSLAVEALNLRMRSKSRKPAAAN